MPNRFLNCEYLAFESISLTTSALLALPDVPVRVRVLLTILEKLFVQPGSGRKDKSLYAGLSHIEKTHVSDVLNVLRTHGYIMSGVRRGDKIWYAKRANAILAKKIIASPIERKNVEIVSKCWEQA